MLQGWLVRIWCLFGPWDAYYRSCCCVADQRHSGRMILCSGVSQILATNFTIMIRSRIQPEIPWWLTLHSRLTALLLNSLFVSPPQFGTFGTFDDCWTKFFSECQSQPDEFQKRLLMFWIDAKLAHTFHPCLQFLFRAFFPTCRIAFFFFSSKGNYPPGN